MGTTIHKSRVALWLFLSSLDSVRAGMDLSGLEGASWETWERYKRLGFVTLDYSLSEKGYRVWLAHREAGQV